MNKTMGSRPWKTPHHANYQRRHYNNHQHQYQQQSQNDFWCETCDRGFRTEPLLNAHIAEHQKCGIDGCQFVAHPKLVTAHIQMQHSTGLYNRIRNLETPEDIQKWIEERKKNYPSKENVLKKKSQLEECIHRGEKLQPDKSRFNQRKGNNGHRENGRKSFNDRRNNFKNKFNRGNSNETNQIGKKPNKPRADVEKPIEEESYCGVAPFKGISQLLREESMLDDEGDKDADFSGEIEDDEWDDKTNPDASSSKSIGNALGGLVDAYKSSSDDDDPPEEKSSVPKVDPSENVTVPVDSDSGPEESTIKKEKESDILENTVPAKKCDDRLRKRKRKADTDAANDEKEKEAPKKKPETTFDRQLRYYKSRPSTLLEKLLEKEIRHERNVILQCITHIVKNNFFEYE